MTTVKFLAFITAISCCLHCGSGSDSNGKGQSPSGIEGAHGSCSGASDCAGSEVCVAVDGSGGACAPTCSISGNDCSGQASCGQLGTVSVNVCKAEGRASGSGGAGEASSDAEIYIPCKSDAECQALDEGAVCATDQHGARECTVLCAKEADCNVPSVAGIGVDFFECTTDKGNESRTVCLFDPKCDSDPMSCTTGFDIDPPVDDPVDGSGGDGNDPGGTGGFPGGNTGGFPVDLPGGNTGGDFPGNDFPGGDLP